jgi:hypothetical protein
MDSSRHFGAVLSPKFLTADWPRFEWKSVVADDLNSTRGACSTFLSADRHSPGGRRISRPSPTPLHPCTVTEFLARGKQGRRRWSNRRRSGGNKRRPKTVLNYGVIE